VISQLPKATAWVLMLRTCRMVEMRKKRKPTRRHFSKNCAIGLIRVHPRGFGFLKPEEGPDSEIFVPKRKMGGAVDGDFVEVEIFPSSFSDKGPEGAVKKVIKRGRSRVAGTICGFYTRRNIPYAFSPLLGDKNLIRIDGNEFSNLNEGDRVILSMKEWGGKNAEPHGELKEVIGHIDDPSCDIPAAILEHELPEFFPDAVLEEAQNFGNRVTAEQIKGRLDLREQECFTIDPTTAKDFDDALTLKKDKKGHYYLGVHIADVSHYVKHGSALDKEARKRCNSTYLPGFVVPMLPHELSSHLCSLKPNVNRLAVSVLVELDQTAEVLNYKIQRSVIKSKKRFTYEEAKEVLDGRLSSPYLKTLKLMVELCRLLKKKRAERGSIEFALPDMQLKMDKNGNPKEIEIVEYDITHQLVEEFMLKANEIVARHLSDEGKPLSYRIHGLPSDDHLKEFTATATALGYPLPFPVQNEDLQDFFDEVRETPLGRFFATSFIRCMKLASYSTENIGHYGLGLEHYTHFTSPIRRYIDLTVHRALMNEPTDQEDLEAVAELCSERERLSAKAEGQVNRLKRLRLLKDLVEKGAASFKGVVTGVKSTGITFEVLECMIEGYLPLDDLPGWWEFSPETLTIVNKKRALTYGSEISIFPDVIDLISLEVLWSFKKSEK
jgi:ribonuclease R